MLFRSRNEAGIATIAVGAISEADHVNSIIAAGRADLCAIGRPHLANPAWTLTEASHFSSEFVGRDADVDCLAAQAFLTVAQADRSAPVAELHDLAEDAVADLIRNPAVGAPRFTRLGARPRNFGALRRSLVEAQKGEQKSVMKLLRRAGSTVSHVKRGAPPTAWIRFRSPTGAPSTGSA